MFPLILPYVNDVEAGEYFSTRLNTSAWDYASQTDRVKALSQATALINRLKFRGQTALASQTNAFPRIIDHKTILPDAIKIATCEIALVLLDDFEIEQEISNLFTNSQSYASVSTGQIGDVVPEYTRSGIPSAVAWEYLKPYLCDPNTITIRRG
jgi:hypothetical protein